jgi:hypothetical protein
MLRVWWRDMSEDEFSAADLTFEEIKEHLRDYIYRLERLEGEKTERAYDAIVLTARFLKSIGVFGRAYVPLFEGAAIIRAQTHHPIQVEKTYRAIALKLLIEGGTSETSALKTIVGNDAGAARILKNFTKAMLRKDTRYPIEKELYDAVRSDLRAFAPDVALNRALTTCGALRERKVYKPS